ncbi:MAG: protein translocase subunit SecF [Methanobacteriaceae archaeon]|nr:protein translocase subunit SecF [Methanobacteriaceae archaeon]
MKINIMESYKPFIAIPVIITLIALALIIINGLPESIDLQGGSIAGLNLEKPVDRAELTNIISQGLGTTDLNIKSLTQTQAIVEIGGTVDVIKLTDSLSGVATIESFKSVGPLVSQQALTQVYWAIAFAFIFMSITVLIIFRNLVPSVAVILSALSDILIAVGGMSLLGIPLSVASVGAILMLIGYSVDTDILLTTRLLKRREGTVMERASDAFKTGLVMSASAISALSVLYIVVVFYIPYAQVLSEIAAVLIIGLLADLLTTWLMNLGILRWYLEAKR